MADTKRKQEILENEWVKKSKVVKEFLEKSKQLKIGDTMSEGEEYISKTCAEEFADEIDKIFGKNKVDGGSDKWKLYGCIAKELSEITYSERVKIKNETDEIIGIAEILTLSSYDELGLALRPFAIKIYDKEGKMVYDGLQMKLENAYEHAQDFNLDLKGWCDSDMKKILKIVETINTSLDFGAKREEKEEGD